jgi:hypothetical protein
MRRLPLLSVLLAVACTPVTQTTSGAFAPATEPTPGMTGMYTTTLAASDIPATASAELRNGTPGTWALDFREGSRFVVMFNGAEVVQGSYRLDGDRVVFATGETGPYACNVPAEYTVNRSGNQLAFTKVGTDTCEGRVLAITSRPFTRAP